MLHDCLCCGKIYATCTETIPDRDTLRADHSCARSQDPSSSWHA